MHLIRILLELSGLLIRRKGRFRATRLGQDMTRAERSGELFALVFAKHFTDFNLAYGSGAEWPELQAQIGYTFYRLVTDEPVWMTAEEMVWRVVLPPVLDRAPTSAHIDAPAFALETQVLWPLVDFDLMDRRDAPKDSNDRYARPAYRTTPLLRELLSFHLEGEAAG